MPLRYGDPGALAYERPFFAEATHDDAIPRPETVLGQTHGSRLSHPAEIIACFELWAAASSRLRLRRHGQTHEGRDLVHALISSPANLDRLDEILADLARLADPRGLLPSEAVRIVSQTPAVAWLGYSIHGDEVSGADGALALAYHLVASTDSAVAQLLDELVIVIDPCMNPDGRQRTIGMVEQSTGYELAADHAGMCRAR